ncbi:flagellar biosynthesis protein FlgM [Thiorhodococcus mannitoliphagus]|uniref:Flagellar biosynthesis protein FlgM n=1 Tax=Thiorhodococcus mannitoliphagus TaxID=329406 RepID=A0A6P1DRB6_9GAMM|nr:neutral zinc metallopeptidase [Thiorhodococcus mannitoliphagus]NEX19216.1 flagellar biosynthesis protein FlgM [Thiorhodococcus mannitoliphagus]
MRWKDGRRSDNIEDRRGEGFSGRPRGFGPRIGIRGGVGGVLVVVVLLLLGVDPSLLLSQLEQPPMDSTPSSHQTTPYASDHPAGQDQLAEFVSVVLADTEDTWTQIFREHGKGYSDPRLVLFSGATRSACGLGEAAMGPFYCPGDQKVYIDLAFYDELRSQFGAPGDFAQAYVIAHEVGHHVQNLLGISDQVQSLSRRSSKVEANALSVRLELQADCFAGLWANRAHKARNILEQGDVEEGLNAASAIGDDRLQRQSRGTVTPDSFTHGSSAQRLRWFKRGLQSGELSACDTFSAERL